MDVGDGRSGDATRHLARAESIPRSSYFPPIHSYDPRFSMTDGQPVPPVSRRRKSGNALIVIYWERETGLGGRWTSASVPSSEHDPRSPLIDRRCKPPLSSCFLVASLLRRVDEAVSERKRTERLPPSTLPSSTDGRGARRERDRGSRAKSSAIGERRGRGGGCDDSATSVTERRDC